LCNKNGAESVRPFAFWDWIFGHRHLLIEKTGTPFSTTKIITDAFKDRPARQETAGDKSALKDQDFGSGLLNFNANYTAVCTTVTCPNYSNNTQYLNAD
jgi:hypothetical protein